MGREPGKSRSFAGGASPEEVANYLRDHPDYLVNHPELLVHLTPPEERHGGSVADFQYFMLERLRGEVRQLRDQHRELIANSRANLNNQSRIHAAALFLIDARSFEQLIQTITTDLAVFLDLDVASLLVETPEHGLTRVHTSGIRLVETGTVASLLGRREMVLRRDIEGDPLIFGSAAGLVRSEALIRLTVGDHAPNGLLAFGSREPDAFHQGQGTELISFLARVVERCIRGWLDIDP